LAEFELEGLVEARASSSFANVPELGAEDVRSASSVDRQG
jgi:hypothetical protein